MLHIERINDFDIIDARKWHSTFCNLSIRHRMMQVGISFCSLCYICRSKKLQLSYMQICFLEAAATFVEECWQRLKIVHLSIHFKKMHISRKKKMCCMLPNIILLLLLFFLKLQPWFVSLKNSIVATLLQMIILKNDL